MLYVNELSGKNTEKPLYFVRYVLSVHLLIKREHMMQIADSTTHDHRTQCMCIITDNLSIFFHLQIILIFLYCENGKLMFGRAGNLQLFVKFTTIITQVVSQL